MGNDNGNTDTFDTAILLIVFNRPDSAKKVFDAVKKLKPARLYIASDGPRKHVSEDSEKVEKTRAQLISNIDWPCDVKTLFREENLGCGLNVKLSIDWLFENEDHGIILEDDCIPTNSFFRYCDVLLRRFLNDNRVGMISGSNHYYKSHPIEDSYLFSKFFSCWGWATWKRAWNHMDLEMKWLDSEKKMEIIKNMGYGWASHWYNKNNIKNIQGHIVDAWDFQWCFSLAAQNQLCIFPQKNLVSNIGFGDQATHTTGKPKKTYSLVDDLNFPLKHPEYLLVDKGFDKVYEAKKVRKQLFLGLFPQGLKNRVKKIFFGR